MKTIKLDIIKKNRKYFACKTENGYKARLIIDDNSKDLPLGEQELPVNDRSKRTKYGTDLIFELAADLKEIGSAGIVTLEHFMFNADLVDRCKDLGGKWDGEEKCWVFSDIVADRVDALDDIYNSDLIPIEIAAAAKDYGDNPKDITEPKGPVRFLGYLLARARGRDSGATLGENISLVEGYIDSGGSMKNWTTVISVDAVFRLKVPQKLLEQHLSEDNMIEEWEVKQL